MEVRQRIQARPTRAIALSLALIAAVAVALAVAVSHFSTPTHPQNGIVAPPPHVVGPGMEPDTRDAYPTALPTPSLGSYCDICLT